MYDNHPPGLLLQDYVFNNEKNNCLCIIRYVKLRKSVQLINVFLVPPTAVWIQKKDQHLLAGSSSTYLCGSTGSSPKTKYTWILGNIPLQETSIQVIILFIIKFLSMANYLYKNAIFLFASSSENSVEEF